MSFARYDHVKRPIDNSFWDGLIIGRIVTTQDEVLWAVQRFDYTIFLCKEEQLELIKSAAEAIAERHDLVAIRMGAAAQVLLARVRAPGGE